jgi:hypothetical protein
MFKIFKNLFKKNKESIEIHDKIKKLYDSEMNHYFERAQQIFDAFSIVQFNYFIFLSFRQVISLIMKIYPFCNASDFFEYYDKKRKEIIIDFKIKQIRSNNFILNKDE